uniref:Nonsense-mediated mRNA decay factor SMG8 n=1 Tax=Cacopsylla melanoneura TaxID=428564 RepID=A0A8D8WAV3_9HEMI
MSSAYVSMESKKLHIPLDTTTTELKPYLDSRIVVVSVFGKSARDALSYKANILDDVLKKHVFRNNLFETKEISFDILSDIDAYYDAESSVMFLHLRGAYDTHTLATVCQQISSQLQEKGFLFVWSDLKNKYARAVLFLFLVSHVLILSHPSYTFDMSYVQLFKTLDLVRSRLQSIVQEQLSQVHDISNDWLSLGRLCTPRLLFLFESCPRFLVQRLPDQTPLSEEKEKLLRSFEMKLEDQIFNILRSSRVICHVSAQALFAVPANRRYVYVQTSHNSLKKDWIDFYLSSLVQRSSCLTNGVPSDGDDDWVPTYGLENEEHIMRPERHEFKLFLSDVLDDARYGREFDDDFGSHAYNVRNTGTPTRIERPLLRTWIAATGRLWRTLVMDEASLVSVELSESMDTDIKFSEERCSKVLPLAFNVYKDNLPSHYNTQFHETRVSQAFNSFSTHARGPLFDLFLTKLEDECIKYWTRGRQMCEVSSLKGNPCINPLHKGGSGYSGYEFDSSRADLPIMDHSSGLRFMSTCDCGRTQAQREDPFSLREANYEFYQSVGVECGCAALEHYPFPVFQPSTEDFRAAQLFTNPDAKLLGRRDSMSMSLGKDLLLNATQPGTQGLSLAYASGHSLVSDVLTHHPISVTQPHTNMPRDSNPMSLASQQIVIQVCDSDQEPIRDKALVRQPSTTEYLPGMLHTDSPSSLLPQYPSWSLTYLGPSSLYSHNLGLPDPAGSFVASSSYLLPWDVTVRLQHHSKDGTWNKSSSSSVTSRNSRKHKPVKDLNEFSVKIFIGVEYECPLGHRFMASGPDKILKTCGQGIVKDNGNRVTSSDMPLYFPCPCRSSSNTSGGSGNNTNSTSGSGGSSKRLLAQLMRLHVVTPKAPVHVTLNPRVQPAPPPCPTFVTGVTEPIRLTQSAYWVLRLPYVYAGERGPCLPQHSYPAAAGPGEAPASSAPYARLLAGVYGITEITSEQKNVGFVMGT